MDTTIRNLDEKTYRRLKSTAALSGRSIGELVNEALRAYLDRPNGLDRRSSLRSWKPRDYPEGCERLSEGIDQMLYEVD